ncbi:hypothetical protein BH18CHL1_BH18CHL1_03930 [soil metagenome]
MRSGAYRYVVGKQLVARAVVEAFIDCFGGTALRDVDALFMDLQYHFDPEAEARAQSDGLRQRRSRAAGFISTLDLSAVGDVDRLLRAISVALIDWEREEGDAEWGMLKRLRRNLTASGLAWDGTRLTRLPARRSRRTLTAWQSSRM